MSNLATAEAACLEAFKAAGHAPALDEDGTPDVWGFDIEYHNGFSCAVCWESVCIHCWKAGWAAIGSFGPCTAVEGELALKRVSHEGS